MHIIFPYWFQIRVFRFLSGKLSRVFDESLQTFSELQQMRQQLPDMEFGRRMAGERDLQKSEAFNTANIGEIFITVAYFFPWKGWGGGKEKSDNSFSYSIWSFVEI